MKKMIMILAVFGLMAAPSMAAIVLQNSVSTSAAPGAGADVPETPLLISSFDGTGGNYVLVSVASKVLKNKYNPLTSLTYGGVAMTLIGTETAQSTSYDMYTSVYGIQTSSIGDIVLNYTTADAVGELNDGVSIVAASFSDVGGIGTVSTTKTTEGANQGAMTGSIATTGTDSLIIAALGVGSGATTTYIVDDGTDDYALAKDEISPSGKSHNGIFYLDAATAGTYTMHADWDGSTRSSMVGVELLVPEPATVGMLGLGAVVAMLIRRFRV